jgi:hypothetical protein
MTTTAADSAKMKKIGMATPSDAASAIVTIVWSLDEFA